MLKSILSFNYLPNSKCLCHHIRQKVLLSFKEMLNHCLASRHHIAAGSGNITPSTLSAVVTTEVYPTLNQAASPGLTSPTLNCRSRTSFFFFSPHPGCHSHLRIGMSNTDDFYSGVFSSARCLLATEPMTKHLDLRCRVVVEGVKQEIGGARGRFEK